MLFPNSCGIKAAANLEWEREMIMMDSEGGRGSEKEGGRERVNKDITEYQNMSIHKYKNKLIDKDQTCVP